MLLREKTSFNYEEYVGYIEVLLSSTDIIRITISYTDGEILKNVLIGNLSPVWFYIF